MDTNLTSDSNTYLIKSKQAVDYLRALEYKDHVFIQSSGTSSNMKIYALSKSAVNQNAKDVNDLISARKSDIWMCALPPHHIGGFAIEVRAKLTGSRVVYYKKKWSPVTFHERLIDSKSTILSLVPTQLFDLVSRGLYCPKSVRAVFIGGDHLHQELAEKAKRLRWPIYVTYGMTEFCSQVATSKYEAGKTNKISLLPGYSVKLVGEKLAIKSKKLFTSVTTFIDDKFETQSSESFCLDSYYITNDRVDISADNKIKFKSRFGDTVKFKGHYINLNELSDVIQGYLMKRGHYNKFRVSASNHPRLGKQIEVQAEEEIIKSISNAIKIAEHVFPHLQNEIKVRSVQRIEKSALGKIKKEPTRDDLLLH